MDDEKTTYTLGPYYIEAVPDSNDVHIVSGDQQIIARVMSRASGNEHAPEDRAAMQNVLLFTKAPRMREALEIILEREHEPMHPMIADSVRELLAEIDRAEPRLINHQRAMNQERSQMKARMLAVSSNHHSDNSAGQEEGEEEPDHSFGW